MGGSVICTEDGGIIDDAEIFGQELPPSSSSRSLSSDSFVTSAKSKDGETGYSR